MPMIIITKIIAFAFAIAPLIYLYIGYLATYRANGTNAILGRNPEESLLLVYVLGALSIIEFIMALYLWKNIPFSFLKSENKMEITPEQFPDKDPQIVKTFVKAQTVFIIISAFIEAISVYGLVLVLLGQPYETMIPFVVLTWIGFVIVWPTSKFFDRVGERLIEMEMRP